LQVAARGASWLITTLYRTFFPPPYTGGQVEVSQIDIPIHGLEPAFDGFRIVQFSDLHLDGESTTRERLEVLVAQINALQPDVVAFTGDFVTFTSTYNPTDLIEPLRALRPRVASVAVMGNHDQTKNAETIRRVIRESGMIDLNNAVHTLQRGDACLHIAGVNSLFRHEARLDVVLKALPAGDPAILLAHEPRMIERSAPTGRFALQLSGHTHGGQIRLPLLTRLALGENRRYRSGSFQVGETRLYVNRGIGTVGLPLRVNCLPELTVLTLRRD
jgi:predicted MPP superfamily phosphohydrolase